MPIKESSKNKPGGRPRTAIELAPEGVLAATIPQGSETPTYAYAPLAAGALVPGVAEANIRNQDGVIEALRKALGELEPKSRAVTLVLPDTAVRVFVLDFDTLPQKPAEAIPVLRFRLRKMVPFDVEHAALSYQVLVQGEGAVKVLATVMPGAVLAEYEGAVRAAGYEPGAVLPSSLASLAALNSLEPILAANLSGQALTTSITSGQDLHLFRTVDLPEDPEARTAEIQRSIAVAAAYYEDKLVGRAQRLHYAGIQKADDFARLVGDPELAIVDMVPNNGLGATTALGPLSIAGISGALAGA
jgi:type IV pilus assembly protein PilM